MPHTVQIALFVPSTTQAQEIAQSVFPGVLIVSSMTAQNQVSVAELAGDVATRITCSPGRIDFVWEPRATPPAFNDGDVSLDALTDAFGSIGQFATNLPVARVAIILTYRERVGSPREALDRARSELNRVEIPENATELTYRLNVPSSVDGLMMNRIGIWQTSRIGFVGINVAALGVPEQIFYDIWERTVDVNTLQESPLSSGSAREALEKVVREAVRLGKSGLEAL